MPDHLNRLRMIDLAPARRVLRRGGGALRRWYGRVGQDLPAAEEFEHGVATDGVVLPGGDDVVQRRLVDVGSRVFWTVKDERNERERTTEPNGDVGGDEAPFGLVAAIPDGQLLPDFDDVRMGGVGRDG